MLTVANPDMPLVIIVDRSHANAFATRVQSAMPLRHLARDWCHTDVPWFVYWHHGNTASGIGVRDDRLRQIIAQAITDIGGGLIQWSVDADDIPRVEEIIRDESLRAVRPAGFA